MQRSVSKASYAPIELLPGLLLACSFLFVSCKDVFEDDLGDKQVVLLSPPENWTGTQNGIPFRWEPLEEADRYELQVVTPDFTSYLQATIDTSLSAPEHHATLLPDTYAWRVRAVNGSSRTPWSEGRFTIGSSGDLSDQSVPLLTPGDGAMSSLQDISFAWQLLPGATDHVLLLRQGGGAGPIIRSDTTTDLVSTVSDIPEGAYAWGVQARNANSSSLITYRTLIIDVTPPSTPVLLSPAQGAHLPDSTIALSWTPGQDALTGSLDSLVIFRNGADAPYRSIATSTGYFADSLGVGAYLWRVTGHDGAGNATPAVSRSFSVP